MLKGVSRGLGFVAQGIFSVRRFMVCLLLRLGGKSSLVWILSGCSRSFSAVCRDNHSRLCSAHHSRVFHLTRGVPRVTFKARHKAPSSEFRIAKIVLFGGNAREEECTNGFLLHVSDVLCNKDNNHVKEMTHIHLLRWCVGWIYNQRKGICD